MGHSMVNFYRKTYGLPFSNGIICSTTSPLKKNVFLLNKVANHIKQWKMNNTLPLVVGNLESYKNIIHASDVANAIHIIIKQSIGDNYLICGKQTHKVSDTVMKLYSNAGIELHQNGNIFYEKKTGLQVLIVESGQLGLETNMDNITFNAKKLNTLGWKAVVSLDEMLNELLI